MKLHIIIGDTIYEVEKSIYEQIQNKEEEINSKGYYSGQDVDMMDYLDSIKHNFKTIGSVFYHFQL